MSLDSVALLLEWEKYFNISIPQNDTERINTVKQAVIRICGKLNITELGDKQELFARLQQALITSGLATRLVKGNELSTYYLPYDNETNWQRLATELQLDVPMPDLTNNNTNPRIIFFRKPKRPTYDYSLVTFDDLTEIIAAANYLKLAAGGKPKTVHEVYAAVAGIAADKTGADLYEITRDSSFIADLRED